MGLSMHGVEGTFKLGFNDDNTQSMRCLKKTTDLGGGVKLQRLVLGITPDGIVGFKAVFKNQFRGDKAIQVIFGIFNKKISSRKA